MLKERKKIDKIDFEIVSLLKKRQKLVNKIILEKKELNIPIKDKAREKEIITKLKKKYDNKLVDKIYKEIFNDIYK